MARPVSPARLDAVTLVLPAGGRGERLAQLARGINKAVLKAGKHTLIGRTLALYANAGIRNVVVLVGHESASVRQALGDGTRLGVRITYAMDPKTPVGKGGAIRLALDAGLIPDDRPFIVHNPDDQIVGLGSRFPRMIWNAQRRHERRGAVATAVCVPETAYAYSAFTAGTNGLAKAAVMYPKVRMPTHIGVTLFAAGAKALFDRHINLKKKTDFESLILPRLAARNRLGLAMIPAGSWIPVNDLKGWNALLTQI